jgi:hypothetical protein
MSIQTKHLSLVCIKQNLFFPEAINEFFQSLTQHQTSQIFHLKGYEE